MGRERRQAGAVMAIQATPEFTFPPIDSNVQSVLASASLTASGHKIGVVFHAPKTGTIDRVCFRTGTITGTSSVDVRIETVTAGKPSGTLLGAGSNVSSGTLSSNTNYEVTLTTPIAVTIGDTIALAYAWSAGSVTIVNGGTSPYIQPLIQFPGLYIDTGAGYGQISSRTANFALRYNDTKYSSPIGTFWQPVVSTSGTYSSGEKGVRFRLPFTCQVNGFYHIFDPDTTLVFNLYADATAPGGTKLLTKTVDVLNFAAAAQIPSFGHFNSEIVLSANTWYRLTVEVSSASTRFTFTDYPSNEQMDASFGGRDFYLTESSGGTWTDTNTRVPRLAVGINGLDDGVGGLILPRAMHGGYSA